jgi:predicted nucleic acid-binding protein
MIVIADTSPINYLVLIDSAELLPTLFDMIVVPQGVIRELRSSGSPSRVREWSHNLPSWIEIRVVGRTDPTLERLGIGEREGICLAQELGADLILLDDLQARNEAQRRRLKVTGTLGILRAAASRDLIDLPSVLRDLQSTSFYAPQSLILELLEEDNQRKRSS